MCCQWPEASQRTKANKLFNKVVEGRRTRRVLLFGRWSRSRSTRSRIGEANHCRIRNEGHNYSRRSYRAAQGICSPRKMLPTMRTPHEHGKIPRDCNDRVSGHEPYGQLNLSRSGLWCEVFVVGVDISSGESWICQRLEGLLGCSITRTVQLGLLPRDTRRSFRVCIRLRLARSCS